MDSSFFSLSLLTSMSEKKPELQLLSIQTLMNQSNKTQMYTIVSTYMMNFVMKYGWFLTQI